MRIAECYSKIKAEQIVSAVNNTYGNGIKPESVEVLYLNLKSALNMIERLDRERPDPGFETALDHMVTVERLRIEMVLTAAKL